MKSIRLSPGAAEVIATLAKAGNRAYVVGGCVRDCLLGVMPHDWDVCTSATPHCVIDVFGEKRCIRTGMRHGTVTVRAAGELIEVTTWRVEGNYSDGRHPDTVTFVGDIEKDLARRDFTVNAMAYNEEDGLIDPFGGREDLMRRTLRAVGNARTRFCEDALRILRLFRFGAKLNFTLEAHTCEAALGLVGMLSHVSAERIYSELVQLLMSVKPGNYLPETLAMTILPEALCAGSKAYGRRLTALNAAESDLHVRFAILLCDAGEKGAQEALLRLRAPNAIRRTVCQLTAMQAIEQETEGKPLRVQARRLMGRMTLEDMKKLSALRRAQIAAGVRTENEALDGLLRQARALHSLDECVNVKGLAVHGNELAAACGAHGRELGNLMNSLLERVICEELPNEREALLCAVRTARSGNQ